MLGLQTLPDLSHPEAGSSARRMYRCFFCGRVVARRTPASRVVIETRPKFYRRRPFANRPITRVLGGRRRTWRPDDPGGVGCETVREALACPACAQERRRQLWPPASGRGAAIRLRVGPRQAPSQGFAVRALVVRLGSGGAFSSGPSDAGTFTVSDWSSSAGRRARAGWREGRGRRGFGATPWRVVARPITE